MTTTISPITFREDRDLVGTRVGVYREELGERIVYVSPAIYGLLQGDEKSITMTGLMVAVDGHVVWLMDLQ